MKCKSKLLLPITSAFCFILLIILVKTVDIRAIGVFGTEIGLSHLNDAAHKFFGSNTEWYKITEFLGLAAIASGSVFALIGLVEVIKRKSIIKVDREILCLGGLYITLGIVYALFEKVIVNYRPVLAPGETEAEASFPSSHTVLSVVIMISIVLVLDKYIKDKTMRQIVSSICMVLAVLTVIGRILSGVHWITDILGGIFLSVFLLSCFNILLKKKEKIDRHPKSV